MGNRMQAARDDQIDEGCYRAFPNDGKGRQACG